MLIKSEFDIQFQLPLDTAMLALLHRAPQSVDPLLKIPDKVRVQHVPYGNAWETGTDLAC